MHPTSVKGVDDMVIIVIRYKSPFAKTYVTFHWNWLFSLVDLVRVLYVLIWKIPILFGTVDQFFNKVITCYKSGWKLQLGSIHWSVGWHQFSSGPYFFLWIVVWKLVWSARMSPMKNLSANSNQVGFTCTSFMQLQKQVIDKCKKKQFLKLEHKDVDFLKSIFLSESTN